MRDPAWGSYARRRTRLVSARAAWNDLADRRTAVSPAHRLLQCFDYLYGIGARLSVFLSRCWFLWPSAADANARPALPLRFLLHTSVALLTLVVLLGEEAFSWSQQAIKPPPDYRSTAAQRSYNDQLHSSETIQVTLSPVADTRSSQRPAPRATRVEPLAPVVREPVRAAGPAFRAELHQLGADETLGAIAARYHISLESLIWSNGLENGDVLMLNQSLRIPRLSGLPYVVQPGDTLDSIGARFGVPAEIIVEFQPKRLSLERPLLAGEEIYIPGGTAPLPEPLLSLRGGLEGLAASHALPAAIVRNDGMNIRAGPDVVYESVAQVAVGRRAHLLARHNDWLKIELGGVAGWARADLLDTAPGLVETLPETDDFPPPPPIWVWPAHGALTSGFGPRWGSFHNALDIANGAGSPIVAARAGQITEAGWCSGYGYCVKINHGGGISTVYGHLIADPVVSVGDTVKAGEVIGYMGSTYDLKGGGYSTGVHLHFEVRVNGQAVDPLKFLP